MLKKIVVPCARQITAYEKQHGPSGPLKSDKIQSMTLPMSHFVGTTTMQLYGVMSVMNKGLDMLSRKIFLWRELFVSRYGPWISCQNAKLSGRQEKYQVANGATTIRPLDEILLELGLRAHCGIGQSFSKANIHRALSI